MAYPLRDVVAYPLSDVVPALIEEMPLLFTDNKQRFRLCRLSEFPVRLVLCVKLLLESYKFLQHKISKTYEAAEHRHDKLKTEYGTECH